MQREAVDAQKQNIQREAREVRAPAAVKAKALTPSQISSRHRTDLSADGVKERGAGGLGLRRRGHARRVRLALLDAGLAGWRLF